MAPARSTLLNQLRRLTEPAAPVSDAALLKAFLTRRDSEAFAALVRRHGPLVLGVCRRVLRHEQDAEDAFQATFLILSRHAHTLRRPEALAAWLHDVARHTALRARASAARRRQREQGAALPPATDLLDELSARELLAVVDEELARLPEAYRLPLLLCCLQGLSQEEAARRLGWSPGSVKGRLERGRTRLQRRLRQRGLGLSAGLTAWLVADTATAGVPATLLASTTVGAVTGSVPPGAAALATSALSSLAVRRLHLAALLLAVGLCGTGAALLGRTEPPAPSADPPGEPIPAAPVGPPKPRVDRFGDPLPDGALARLGTVRFRQGGGYVNALLLTPDGKTLISNSYYGERSVCAWELSTGKLLHHFPGHYEEIRAVALSPDGKTLATGHDTLIRFWDLASGRETGRLTSPVGGTEGLAYTPDGKQLASGHSGQTVLLWDLTGRKVLARLPAPHNRLSLLKFTPDGKTLATSDCLDKNIRLFDVAARRQRFHLTRPSFVHDLTFAPDGATLAAGGKDGSIPIWDVSTGKLVGEMRGPGQHVRAVAFAPDGRCLATSEFDEKTATESIRLWDPATGKEQGHIPGHWGLVESLVFTGDGKTLLSGGRDSVIRRWDVATGQEQSPAGHQGPVYGLALAPGGRTLAYADKDVRLWDLASGREVGTLPNGVLSFGFSPDARTLAVGVCENVIYLWDVNTRKLVRRLEGDPKNAGRAAGQFNAVAFSPDGKVLASAGTDSVVRLWDPATGKELRQLPLTDQESEFCTAEAVAFAPDGRVLAASGRGKRAARVRLWDPATGKELAPQTAAWNGPAEVSTVVRPRSWEDLVAPRVVFSPDGRLFAMSRRQKTISIWEAATGQERCRLEGHEEATSCVALAPDGRTLASASYDETIRLWDVATGRELRRLTGHRGKPNALAFTADGRTLFSGGDDTTVLFWDVAAVTRRERPAEELALPEWETLWADLAGADATEAHRAMARLTAAARLTATELKDRLRPAPGADEAHLARLLNELDSNDFAAREKASAALGKLGDVARPAIERALARPGTSLELRKRLEGLIDRLAVPAGEHLRELRALEILERLGTPEVRRVLEVLAKGAPEARLTREARATLRRLATRP
jgi:RNA polymerase sigma factor (sigma-70 family)